MHIDDFPTRHQSGPMIRMPNAWDPGSAKIMVDAGAEALGTTSAGIVYAMGLPDYQGALSREACLRATEAICRAVPVPVSVDSEDGYGETPEAVAETFALLIAAGAAGGSIEDHPREPGSALLSVTETCERIAAARGAIDRAGRPFVLTARAECFLLGHPDPLAESIRRLNLYRKAGADCLYAPGIRTKSDIQRLLAEVDGPVNVLVGIKGVEPSLDDLEAMGVRRVSTGGSVACAALGLARSAVHGLTEGRLDYLSGAIPHAELGKLFGG